MIRIEMKINIAAVGEFRGEFRDEKNVLIVGITEMPPDLKDPGLLQFEFRSMWNGHLMKCPRGDIRDYDPDRGWLPLVRQVIEKIEVHQKKQQQKKAKEFHAPRT